MIDQLITALSKEVEMSAEEIADTIWLALQMQEFQAESVSSDFSIAKEDERRISQLEQETLPKAEPKTSELEETPNQPPEEQKAGIYPRNEQQTSKSLDLSFKVPDAPSLREPLTLARALKPLMRRIASGRELVLDEAATIQRIADEGLWIPVLKPTLEPWLDLELVVDEAISMQIWRHAIRELERLLKNYGIFRDVRVWGLITDENEQLQIRRGIGAAAKNQTLRSPKELIDPSGRRLVLVVSDCVSSLWRDGEVTPILELWAKQGSMAIVQMLPKWLWKRTALGRASEVRLRGLTPGVSNQKLVTKVVSLWDELDEETGVKVPVFTLEQDKVATWAQMLSGKGNIWTLGYVFKLNATPLNKESSLFNLTHSDLSAEQRVQAFRVTASPIARKLAGLLASAPVINLPIVRLIRETLLKDSQQVHVAEVFLGGLLKPLSKINTDTNPDYVQYEFMDGVRELLVDSVPSQYVLNVVDEVSKYVAKKVGLSLEDFAAVLRNPQEVKDIKIADAAPFAMVTAQILRRLGGKYVKVAEELELNNFVRGKKFIRKKNVPTQFQSWIAHITEGFVGREYVFDAIEAFIANNPKGYFTIIGDPGQGKSAILAKYVQDTGCIAHFNVWVEGLNRADQFLKSVCRQLIECYELSYDSLPPNATRDGEFLEQLLDEVTQKRKGEAVIIAVDALDEVDKNSYRDAANILYLPAHLPDGVYFILTRRRGVEVPLTSFAPMQTINLLDFQTDTEQDVRAYIENRLNSSDRLRQRIDERRETIKEFTDKIAEKSENNFMYLRYILSDIESGLYQDLTLEQFPQGLQSYYENHWQRMGMTGDTLTVETIKILYLLCEVREPISRRKICTISGEDEYTVQRVLDKWKEFLREEIKNDDKRYIIYHPSFQDFLSRQDISLIEETKSIINQQQAKTEGKKFLF